MKPQRWTDYLPLADHYRAIGQTRIALYASECVSFPWEHVTAIANGGTYRNEIPVSVSVEAAHPCGLTFAWFLDLETRDANGTDGYRPNLSLLREVVASIPVGVRPALVAALDRMVAAMRKRADGAASFAAEQREAADQLAGLACVSSR